jgi:hypothetical protein
LTAEIVTGLKHIAAEYLAFAEAVDSGAWPDQSAVNSFADLADETAYNLLRQASELRRATAEGRNRE